MAGGRVRCGGAVRACVRACRWAKEGTDRGGIIAWACSNGSIELHELEALLRALDLLRYMPASLPSEVSRRPS